MSIFDTTPQDRYAVAPPPLAERPTNDFGQSFDETFPVERVSRGLTAADNALANYFADTEALISAATGEAFRPPDVTTRDMPGDGELPPGAFLSMGNAMGAFRVPGLWAKDIEAMNRVILENNLDVPILSPEEHSEALNEMVFQANKRLGETEQSFWGSLAGGALADIESMGQNPLYGATNLVGGAAVKGGTSLLSNVARAFVSNGLINMAITGAVTPATKKWRDDVGLKYSFAEIAAEFGGSFVLGGALGGAISVPTHLLVNGATPGQRFAKELGRAVDETTGQQIDAALSNREVLAGIRALQADGVPIPAAVRGAADEIEAQTELFDDNPLDGDDAEIEHIVRAVEAEIALENDTPIRVPDQPAAAPAEPASTPTRDPAPEGQIAVFDSVGNQQNLEVVARSPNGGVIVRLPDGKELLLGSELTKFDPLSPDFVVDALPNAPRISGLPDRELASLEASRLERIADFEAEDATNQGGYEQAKRDLTAARAETGRRRQPRSYVRPITDVNYYDNLDDTIFRFDPADVEVDAAVFQFKGSGDAVTGVTNEYRGVTEWDPNKAGQVLVYEHTDGRRIIADGHQRLGMAKRIMANDPSQKPKLYGSLLREADGITPEMARVIAAKKNIGEGSGTAVDAAEILRLDPDALTDTSLRRSTEMFRNARDMMDLGPGAFDLVKKGVIPENQAAIVGRLVKDPDQQMAVMRLLSDIEPGNLTEAEAIVRQAINAEFDNVTTLDMFGEEQIAESLFKERAKVLDATLKLLRNERAVFNSLVKNEGRISGEGNVLATEQNRTRSQTDGEAIATIQKAANRKGELSDALTAAARAFKETGKLSSASSGFADAVRGSVTRGEFDSVDVGGEIGAVDVAPEINQLAAGPSKDVLDGFDNPDGPGVRQQADQLEQDFVGGPREAQQPDVAMRQDLQAEIDAGATRDEIDAHPAILDALEQAAAIPETKNAPGYLGDDWINSREFIFDGETVVGYEAGVQRLYENARGLGWTDDGLEFPGVINQDKRATIVLGPPAAGKSTFANKFAQARSAAIIDPDEAKKVLPEYEGGIGANAVHAESSELFARMLEAAIGAGDNVVLPRTGGDQAGIDKLITMLERQGYEIDLILMDVTIDNAHKRMIGRFIGTGRLINPQILYSIGNNPQTTYNALKGRAQRYGEIDNNGAPDAPLPTRDTSADNPFAGVELRLRDTSQRGDRSLGAEVTGQGEQTLIPGVEPVTDAQRAQLEVDRPMRGGDRPMDVGLFDTDAQAQTDLLDLVPVGQELDPSTGNLIPTFRSKRELVDEIRQDEAMLDRFKDCV